MTHATDNPYVGPRTFTRQEGDRFFGRDHEAQELLSLVISERLVLFYAQSGAGKSSLLNARLLPQLEESGFALLPPGRVGGALPQGVTAVNNIFIFNLMLSLQHDEGRPDRFADLTLTEFLARLTSADGQHYYCQDTPVSVTGGSDEAEGEGEGEGEEEEIEGYEETPYVLLIDQFEELFTTHPEHWRAREDFFRQLSQAMVADSLLWVVLSMREDYVAALDPYVPLLPDGLRARFHMQRLDYEAALAAVQKPAALHGRPFAPAVAEHLVDNLRQIRVHGQTQPQPGQFVEPVQLQVVCYQLWENLRERPPASITQADLPLDYIDRALIQFYETVLRRTTRETRESERSLRHWFQTQLITEANTRGTVYRGPEQSGGLDNQAAALLAEQFLLRSEVRAGGVWYELTHDRFINPILKSNADRQIGRLQRQSGVSTGLVTLMLGLLLVGLLHRFWEERRQG